MFEFWWLFPIALAICVSVCTVGISGSVLFVPFFTLAFPVLGTSLTPTEAIQIGLFTEIFGFASSTSAFLRNRLVDFRVAGFALLFAVPAAVAGGVLANVLSATAVLVVISFAMLLFSFLLYRAPKEDQAGTAAAIADVPRAKLVEHRDRQGRTYRYRRTNDRLRAAAMAVGGAFEGLVGFAVGEIAVTEQTMRRMPLRVAIGTNHLIIAGSAIAAALTHLTAVLGGGGSRFPWSIVAMTVPAVLIGGQLAGWLAGHVPQDALRRFLAAFLIVLSAVTIARAVADAGIAADWLLIGATVVLFGLIGRLLWRRGALAAKLCYSSRFYYWPPNGRLARRLDRSARWRPQPPLRGADLTTVREADAARLAGAGRSPGDAIGVEGQAPAKSRGSRSGRPSLAQTKGDPMPETATETEAELAARAHDIAARAAEFTTAHPELDPSQQRLVLATIRLLGEGAPVAPQAISERTGRPLEEVAAYLDEAPTLERDEQGRVLAFFGLTLEPTSHAIEVDGRTLYAWCALDTLFLPERLGRPARIRSTCPQTGATISLTVDEGGVHEVAPQGAVMTLHGVGGLDLADAVGTFCCFVQFFASEEAAVAWSKRSEGTYVASIAEGFEYGRLFNRAWLGDALEEH